MQLARRCAGAIPGLQIVGGYSPPFRALTRTRSARSSADINASGADVVWVGTGQPKQEKWMAEMRDRLDAPILAGVGAAFDFHAGLVPQAPAWMQRRPGVVLPPGARAAAAVAALRALQPALRGRVRAPVRARTAAGA